MKVYAIDMYFLCYDSGMNVKKYVCLFSYFLIIHNPIKFELMITNEMWFNAFILWNSCLRLVRWSLVL